MKTFTKVLLTGAVLATLGAGAAIARGHGPMGMGMGGPGMGPMGEKIYERICSAEAPKFDGSKMAARLADKLKLNDSQKTAFDDLHKTMQDTRAASRTSLCADPKPDFASMPGRAAFGIRMTENRLSVMKTMQPKLEAFYNTLSDEQKKTFNQFGPHPGGPGGPGGWEKGHGHGHGGPMDGPDAP